MIFSSIITDALKNKHPLPRVVMETSLARDVDDLLHEQFDRARFAVVDDSNTSYAMGDTVWKAVMGSGTMHITLPGAVKALHEQVEDIRARTRQADVIIAVGSGTVNDLCKRASFLDGKPYVVVPTAASMNGYLSANASITQNGHKTTLPAHMPSMALCDLSVLSASPARLPKSGLGDSIARSTAQADWLLSHLLLGTHYQPEIFEVLLPSEAELHANARGIAMGDSATIRLLMENLLLSGIGMTMAGGSYPASQGEHMIAHTREMLREKSATHTLHGEEIAVTTTYMATLQESLLRSAPRLHGDEYDKPHMTELFGYELAEEFDEAYLKKQQRMETYHERLENWQAIAEQIEKVMLPSAHIAKVLEAAGLSAAPATIGWTEAETNAACGLARFTRDRFTFLDLRSRG